MGETGHLVLGLDAFEHCFVEFHCVVSVYQLVHVLVIIAFINILNVFQGLS